MPIASAIERRWMTARTFTPMSVRTATHATAPRMTALVAVRNSRYWGYAVPNMSTWPDIGKGMLRLPFPKVSLMISRMMMLKRERGDEGVERPRVEVADDRRLRCTNPMTPTTKGAATTPNHIDMPRESNQTVV